MVCAPAEEETDEVTTYPRRDCRDDQYASSKDNGSIFQSRLTSHQLGFDRRESQTIYNRRREERQRSQRHTVADICQIVHEHPWAEESFQDFSSRSMFVGISSSSDFDPSFDELLVVFSEPLGAGRVVRQEEQGQQGAKDGDEAFDDELSSWRVSFRSINYESLALLTSHLKPSSPAAPFMCPTPSGSSRSAKDCPDVLSDTPSMSVMFSPTRNTTAKRTRSRSRRKHESDTNRSLLNWIPESDEEDDAYDQSAQSTRERHRTRH